MIKDVMIDMKGIQQVGDQTDTIEFRTEGRFGEKDGTYFLSYDEGQMLENATVKTKIFVGPDHSLVLQRNGDVKSRMEISEGSRSSCFYRTDMGDICIGIYGEQVEVHLNESGGSIRMRYTIDSDLRFISRNQINITIKEVTECQC